MRFRHALVVLLTAGLTVSSAPPPRAIESAPSRSATTAGHAAPGAPPPGRRAGQAADQHQRTRPAGSKRGTGSRAVALTFDDGPGPVHTPKLLDVLKAHRVKIKYLRALRQLLVAAQRLRKQLA